jgi:type II secretory pathway pseudopilin PulG
MLRTARRRRRHTGDAGFTLIELSVAMFVTLLVVTSLVGVFVKSLGGLALSKQRQAASALATGTMEQFRAMEYGTLASGMACDDLVGDPHITITGTCGAGGTVTFAPGVSGISETVKVQTSTPASAIKPIYPHVEQRSIEEVTYDVASYVTTTGTAQESFQLTVLVTWTSNVSNGEKLVIQRSVAYSPSRCLSSATHPYSGACQAAFRGDAGTTNAGIRVVEADGTGGEILGLDGTEIGLAFPTLSATLGSEQISKLSGTVATMSGFFVDGSSQVFNGGAGETAAADNDPSSVDATSDSGTVAQPSLTTVQASGTAGVLSARPTTADSGSIAADTTSDGTSCLDDAGTALPATGLPCTTGAVKAHGSTGALDLDLAGTLPTIPLAAVGASPQSSRAVTARMSSPGTTACPTASGLGCVTSMVRRQLGDISLGGLPGNSGDDTPPAGFDGYLIKVTGVDEQAWAESGFGARTTPGFVRHAGTLNYYDSTTSSYQTVLLKDLTSDLDVALGTVTGSWTHDSQTFTVAISGSLRAGSTTLIPPTTTAPDPDCKDSACEQAATVASTLIANLTYEVTVGTSVTTRFTVVTDLGAPLARSSYKAAFDA